MKKFVCLVLCIAIVAIALIAVITSQRNNAQQAGEELGTQVSELQKENEALKEKIAELQASILSLNSKYEEAKTELEESQKEAETESQLRITAEQESEERIKQTEETLEQVKAAQQKTEEDKQQVENELAAASQYAQELESQVAQKQADIDTTVDQLRLVAQQAQEMIVLLTGEDEETIQQKLADAEQELETMKADYVQVTGDLLAAQDQLKDVRSALEASEAARYNKTLVRLYQGEELALEFEDLSTVGDQALEEGLYRMEILVVNPAGETIVQYELLYPVTAKADGSAAERQEEPEENVPGETEPEPEEKNAEPAADPTDADDAAAEAGSDVPAEAEGEQAPEDPVQEEEENGSVG